MPTCAEVKERLEMAFPYAQIDVKDLRGSGDYFDVWVKSGLFNGKNRVQQHQLVMHALGEWMKKAIHAVSIKTEEDLK